MKTTPHYKLPYFTQGEKLNSSINIRGEIDRFLNIDNQIYGLYKVIGNGVVDGWDIFDNGYSSSNGISIGVTVGYGVIDGFAAESTTSLFINKLLQNNTYYVYATFGQNNPTTRSINILVSNSLKNSRSFVLLGSIVTNSNGIFSIDVSDKEWISFTKSIKEEVDSHRHRGTPSKIDLAKEVKNRLPSANIDYISSDKISKGVLSSSLLRNIDHDEIKNGGNISHSQIETYLSYFNSGSTGSLYENSMINLLKLNTQLKYHYSDITYGVNSSVIIPGVDNSLIDFDNSTAQINRLAKCIVGSFNKDVPVYFYSTKISFPETPKKILMVSEKNDIGEVLFGVNFSDSLNFEDCQEIDLNEITNFVDPESNEMRIVVKLTSTEDFSQDIFPLDEFGDEYLTNTHRNVVNFDFTNSEAFSILANFRISFYSDVAFSSLVYSTETFSSNDGFNIDNEEFDIGGETVTSLEQVNINFDTLDVAELIEDTTYYMKIEYHDGSSWNLLSDSNVFIKLESPMFRNYLKFSYTNEEASDTEFSFRARFYSDKERTNLFLEKDSISDQTGWLVEGEGEIPPNGYVFSPSESKNIHFYPKTVDFSEGTVYYVSIDAFNGSEYVNENNEFTFSIYGESNSDGLGDIPIVNSISFLVELENGVKVII